MDELRCDYSTASINGAEKIGLLKALYGHPQSGAYWERHCEAHLKAQGFKPVPAWRSCFFHPFLKTYLVIYVDDFKLAGTQKSVTEAWRLIQTDNWIAGTKGLNIDGPEPVGRYLGCDHKMVTMEKSWHGNTMTELLDTNPASTSQAGATNTHKRVLFEFCCGEDSLIGQRTSSDCRVIRLTEDIDMTSDAGLQFAVAELKM
ncbi:MAG TPA: hypothetical protein EYQ00_03075, partial [Dehalococcoidia bacterium]|nr:hypothetical protein [Dehalococcoidia bacterium]